jgi:serine/threonine protein kinase
MAAIARTGKSIIYLKEVFEDRRCLMLVTELCRGGELYDQIVTKSEESDNPTGGFTEYEAAVMMRQIFSAVDSCHRRGKVVHRDIKPENILLVQKDDVSQLRLIDFGLSRFFEPGQRLRTRVGTVYYTAPEVWKQDYDEKCDLWSMGVILYVLICSYPPFDGDDDEDILNTVMKGRYKFHSPEWDGVSDEAKSLIRSLLHRNSRKRPTATQALEHPWFRSQLSDAESESSDEDLDEDAWDDDMYAPEATPEASRLKGISGGGGNNSRHNATRGGGGQAARARPAPVISEESSTELTEKDLMNISAEADLDMGDEEEDAITDLVAEPRATSIATSSFNAAASSSSAQRAVEGRRVAGRRSEPVVGSRGGGGGGGGGGGTNDDENEDGK